MKIDIYTIIYTLGIGLFGYFLRDIYNFIKKKLIKGDKPKTSLSYSYRHISTSGTYPRNYSFNSKILFKNIDTEPIYEVKVYQIIPEETIVLKSLDSLPPNQELIIENKIEIPFGDTGSQPKEAEKTLPVDFRTPNLKVKFQNKNGHLYQKSIDS